MKGEQNMEASRTELEQVKALEWWDVESVSCKDIATLNLGDTAYKLIGEQGDVCLMLHGCYNFSYIWMGLVKRLTNRPDRPLRILLMDFYGRGNSPWPYLQYQCTDTMLAAQVIDLLNFLGLAHERLVIVGHDIGASVASHIAAEKPEVVKALVLISPAGMPTVRDELQTKLDILLVGDILFEIEAKEYLKGIHAREFWPTTDKHVAALRDLHVRMVEWQIDNTPHYLKSIVGTLRHFPLAMQDRDPETGELSEPRQGMQSVFKQAAASLRASKAPILVICGDHDGNAKVKELCECLQVAEVRILDRCGHNVVLEKEEQTADLIFHIIASKDKRFADSNADREGKERRTRALEMREDPPQGKEENRDEDERRESDVESERLSLRETAAEIIVVVQHAPHSDDALREALLLAERAQVRGAIVDNVKKILSGRIKGKEAQNKIQHALQQNDAVALRSALQQAKDTIMQNTYDFTPCQCKDCGAWTADIFPAEEELAKWEKERLHDEMIRTLGVIPFWGFGAKAESGEDMQESLRSGSPQKKYLSGARGAGAAHVGAEVADGGQADKGEKGTGRSGEAEKGNLWAGVASLGDKQGEQGFCSLRREGQKSRGWSLWNLGTALGMGWGAWGEKGGEQHFGSNAEVDFGKGKCYEDESKKQDVMLQTEQMQTAIHGQKEPTMDEALEIFNALDANHDGTLQAYEILIEMDQLGWQADGFDEFMRVADKKKRGRVTRDEFRAAYQQCKHLFVHKK